MGRKNRNEKTNIIASFVVVIVVARHRFYRAVNLLGIALSYINVGGYVM